MSKSRREKNRKRRRQQQVRQSTNGSSSPANPLDRMVQTTTEGEQPPASAALAPRPTMLGVEGFFRIPKQLEGGLGLLAILGSVGRMIGSIPGRVLNLVVTLPNKLRGNPRRLGLLDDEPSPPTALEEKVERVAVKIDQILDLRLEAIGRGDLEGLDKSQRLEAASKRLEQFLKRLQAS